MNNGPYERHGDFTRGFIHVNVGRSQPVQVSYQAIKLNDVGPTKLLLSAVPPGFPLVDDDGAPMGDDEETEWEMLAVYCRKEFNPVGGIEVYRRIDDEADE